MLNGAKFRSVRQVRAVRSFVSRTPVERPVPLQRSSNFDSKMIGDCVEDSERGALIVFEGCDRSGKSTQCQMLADFLRSTGRHVAQLRFPDRTTAIGKTIDSYLQGNAELEDHAIHLLFSANRWEAQTKLNKLIDSGTCVIVDRYAYSGVAFTAAKQSFDLEWCKNPDRGLPCPDLVLYLDISTKDASERADYGEERYEKAEFQERVAEVYRQLKTDDWKVLDATQSIDDIHKQICELVVETTKAIKKPLGKLWTE